MILNIENLSKSFQQGETTIKALQEISLSVSENETLAIVGPSGSGKTTLLALMAGLESSSEGNIYLRENNITQMSESDLAQYRSENIGIVFQQFHLMPHLTALENVMLPIEIMGEEFAKEKATKSLEQVGLGERLSHLPQQLSGGECQRVAIARAFVSKPKLLLADEPSGNLDLNTGTKVMNLLFEQVKEKQMTMILVTHDLDLAKRCDRQVHLSGGKIV